MLSEYVVARDLYKTVVFQCVVHADLMWRKWINFGILWNRPNQQGSLLSSGSNPLGVLQKVGVLGSGPPDPHFLSVGVQVCTDPHFLLPCCYIRLWPVISSDDSGWTACTLSLIKHQYVDFMRLWCCLTAYVTMLHQNIWQRVSGIYTDHLWSPQERSIDGGR